MDLSNFDSSKAEQGSVLQLRNPVTGDVLIDEDTQEPVTITVLGQDSKQYVAAQQKLSNLLVQSQIGSRRSRNLSLLELRTEQIELLARVTIGWQHIVVDGEELPFNQGNVRKVYERFPWIREQVDEFVTDRANFMGNS